MKTTLLLMVAMLAGVSVWIMTRSGVPVAPKKVEFLAPIPLTQYAHVQDGASGAKIAGALMEGVGQLFNFAAESNGGYGGELGNLADGNPFSIGL